MEKEEVRELTEVEETLLKIYKTIRRYWKYITVFCLGFILRWLI